MQGGGAGAHPVAIVYDVDLTLDLPPDGDRRHGDERARPLRRGALRRRATTPNGDEQALAGAPLIAEALPRVLADAARPRRARGAAARRDARGPRARARRARARARDGAGARRRATALPHGAMNALCLPPALEFNRALAPEAVDALRRGDRRRRRRARRASSRGSAASSGSATSAFPRTTCRRVAAAAARAGRQPGEPAPGHARRDRGSCSRVDLVTSRMVAVIHGSEQCIRSSNLRYSSRRGDGGPLTSTCS